MNKNMDDNNKNIHQGHRERLKNQIFENGFDSLQPHQILEYILFFAIPCKDTNEIAHQLIARFGSFNDVLDANFNDLMEIKGMTKNACLLLHTLPNIFYLYNSSKTQPKQVITIENILPYLHSLTQLKSYECMYLVCLDAKNSVTFTEQLSTGNSSLSISIKDIIKATMLHQAKGIILCHNHPSDDVSPSEADIQSTAVLKHTLDLLDIKLLDHIIMGTKTAYSFFLKKIIEHNND
jgi:DNA repair protein RadC